MKRPSSLVSARGGPAFGWRWFVSALVLSVIPAEAGISFAQSPQKPPHEAMSDVTGVITGTLLKDGKTPLGGHAVALEVLSGHQLVLTIPKQTDTKGAYQFKNIFMSPDFSYAISTELNGKIYRTNFVSLKSGEKIKKLDIAVGVGAKEGLPLPPPIALEEVSDPTNARTHKRTNAPNEYQLLAIILSIGAAGYAVYQRKKTAS